MMKNQMTLLKRRRKGAVAIVSAILLVMLLGMVALAVDLGYIMLTKTSMQAATDAACLSAGTELVRGMGPYPVSAGTVTASASAIAKEFAAYHPNGDVVESYIDPERDVRFGYAYYDNQSKNWVKNWNEQIPGVGGYNLIGVTMQRNVLNSTNGDRPLPLLFAPVLGRLNSSLQTTASAVVMPANGVRIGSGDTSTSEVMPFVVNRVLWEKYRRAQAYYEVYGLPSDPIKLQAIMDNDSNNFRETTPTGEPLFGHWVQQNNGDLVFKQDFADLWSCDCNCDAVSAPTFFGSDGYLEVDIFPRDEYTSGNFGTVDVGSGSNSTDDLARQILYGLSEEDLLYLPNDSIQLPMFFEGDTGVSAGIKDELEDIYGECRSILLFTTVESPGNNAMFYVVDMAGIRVMQVEMSGSLDYKHLSIQLCKPTLGNATPGTGNVIGEGKTVFTPLILIE